MRVLIVAYHFHNVTAEGLVTSKLARALVDDGCAVTVLTSDDNELEGETPCPRQGPLAGIAIHRVAADPARVPRWWRRLAAGARRGFLRDKLAALPTLAHGHTDVEHGWLVPAAERAESLWREGGFDLLHSRLNPALGHLVGLRLERRLRLPWCAYFSDPWPPHLYPPPYDSSIGPLHRRRLERILDRILERAGSLIFPAAQLRDHLLAGSRRRFRSKTVIAPHLANPWHAATPLPGGEVLRLRHAGFLMKERGLESLYQALRRLRRDRPELAARLRLELAGRYPGGIIRRPPEDLAELVSFLPFKPADEIWDWMMGAHALLLVEANMTEGIFFPSKLAEYLAAGRPILALSPARGVAAELLAAGGGLRAAPADDAAIAGVLAELVEHQRDGRLERLLPTAEQVARVLPEHVVARYREAFERALAARGTS